MHSFSIVSLNIDINPTFRKLPSLGYILLADGSNFHHCDVIGPKATKFDEITQDNGHYAGQGHSRSSILVPIESPCATSD